MTTAARPQRTRRTRLRAVISSTIAIAALVAGAVAVPASATTTASMPSFIQPTNGNIGDVVRGCPAGSRPSHTGIDINRNAGQPVYASAAGTVTYAKNVVDDNSYGTFIEIEHPEGYTTLYAHMVYNSLRVGVGAQVKAGDQLGIVGTTGNSTGEHLHFEIRRGNTNVANDFYTCGQGSVIAKQPLPGAPVAPTEPNIPRQPTDGNRTFSISPNGTLQTRVGSGPITTLRASIVSFDVDGENIAVIDKNGRVLVRRGGSAAAWKIYAYSATSVAIDGDRIVVLQASGKVIVKDSFDDRTWSTVAISTNAIDAHSGRIGIISTGRLLVKEGMLDSPWLTIQPSGVTDLAMSGDRIGMIAYGRAYGKQGRVVDDWVQLVPGTRIEIGRDRAAVLTTSGALLLQEDGFTDIWREVTGATVTDFSVSGNRISVIKNGKLFVKVGPLSTAFSTAFTSSKKSGLS